MTSSSTPTPWPRHLTSGGAAFKKRVDNPRVFRAYMLAKMPTLGVTGAYLAELDVAACEVVLPYGWGVKDLFGRVALAALMAAAEACAVSLLVLNIRNQGASLTPRARAVSVECLKECRQGMRFVADAPADYGEFVACASAHGDEVRRDLTVLARDERGELTHRVHIEWLLEPK